MAKRILERLTMREQAAREKRQLSVFQWAQQVFGGADTSPRIRMRRLLEEVVELAQAQGLNREDCVAEVDAVFERPVGEVEQEIGGVAVTLMAYCASKGLSLPRIEHREIARINTKAAAHFKQRQLEKHAQGRV